MSTVVNTDGSITWTGTVTFTGATDPLSTGVATLTLTPSGGVSNLPALVNGQPGLPPTFRNITVTQVDPASGSLPAPAWTLVTPGGAGTASVYDLAISVYRGAAGAPGTNASISAAGDISKPTALGAATDGWTLYYSNASSSWVVTETKRVKQFSVPSSSFQAYTGTASRQVLASLQIPAQPWDWRPRVSGHFYALGSATAHVDAEVRVGDSTSGDLVGYGLGLTSAAQFAISLDPHYGSAVPSSAFGKVAAGVQTTVSLVAVRTTASVDTWQTLPDNAQFVVDVLPL